MASISNNNFFNKLGRLYSVLGKHPFLISFLIVVVFTFFSFGAQEYISGAYRIVWSVMGISAPAVILYLCYRTDRFDLKKLAFSEAVLISIGLLLSHFFLETNRAALWIFFGFALSGIMFWFLTLGDKERSDLHNALTIMVLSFSIKFCYVLYTGKYVRQNDVWFFDDGGGHASYIEYLIQNKHLPVFNPLDRWQYYHPPLHHTISAAWISFFENVLGVSHDAARESLQMLMLFYSVAAVIIVYKLLKFFNFSGKSLLIPLALFAFHPAYILSSGSINNDQLAALMTVLTMLFTVRWFKQPDTKHIIPIALSIGFGMMAKLNVGTIAPAVAVLFLIQFVRNADKLKKFFFQYIVFGVICVPLALWWQIKNKIVWGLSITYVPNVGGNQEIEMGIFERLFDLSPKQFSPVFINWLDHGSDFTEYNPNVAILKNSLFGESIREQNFPGGNTVLPTVFFWLATVLALIGVAAIVFFFFKKDTKLEMPYKVFLGVFWAFDMYYFYLFCYTYSATCTMNFRYLTPLLAVSAVEYAMLFDHLDREGSSTVKRVMSKALTVGVVLFCVLSVVTYLTVGYMEVFQEKII